MNLNQDEIEPSHVKRPHLKFGQKENSAYFGIPNSLGVSDRINPTKYEFNLFYDRRNLLKPIGHPAQYWRVMEYYPSYMMMKTPFVMAGPMPIDLPWFYAWLTVIDEEPRKEGFIITNIINYIPPKHYEIGIIMKTQEVGCCAIHEVLEKYYQLRQTVKERIEAFWNGLDDWYPLYCRGKELSRLLLGNPFDPPADAEPMVINAEVREFEALIDGFFEHFIEPESMDQFYTRMMQEIENNKRKYFNRS